MGRNKKANSNFVTIFHFIRQIVPICSIKQQTDIILWLYTAFFGTIYKYTTIYEAEQINLLPVPTLSGIKWAISLLCLSACLSSIIYRKAVRAVFRCIFSFMVFCYVRIVARIFVEISLGTTFLSVFAGWYALFVLLTYYKDFFGKDFIEAEVPKSFVDKSTNTNSTYYTRSQRNKNLGFK